jgi:FkbM family methyltransferase
MLRALKPFIKRGACVLDIGANIGTHTGFYLEAVGLEGTVISIEPHAEAFECLTRNCPLARKYNLALGDSDSTCDLSSPVESTGLSFVIPGNSIRFAKLDTLWTEIVGGKVDFIKLDAEGYEPYILDGARNVISSYRPVMCVEVSEKALKRANTSPDAVYAFFDSVNYRVEKLPEGWADILCRP